MEKPPYTPKRPVIDVLHGVEVIDDYRWLEDTESAESQDWIAAQNNYTKRRLACDDEALRDALAEASEAPHRDLSHLQSAGEWVFALASMPPAERNVLVAFPKACIEKSPLAQPKTLLDPQALDPTGNTTIDWYAASPDGKYLAVSLSLSGDEMGHAHIIDVNTGQCVDKVPDVHNSVSGGHLRWCGDGRSFIYTAFRGEGRQGEPFKLLRHQLMTSWQEDTYEFGDTFVKDAFILGFGHCRVTDRMVVRVWPGTTPPGEIFVREAEGEWWRLSGPSDAIHDAVACSDGSIICFSRREGIHGAIIRVPPGSRSLEEARVIVPESERILGPSRPDRSCLFVGQDSLYTLVQNIGATDVICVDFEGQEMPAPSLPAHTVVTQMVGIDSGMLMHVASDIHAPRWFRHAYGSDQTELTALCSEPERGIIGAKIHRDWAVSKDGTRVPFTMILPEAYTPGKPYPCIVTGYGSFGLCLEPRFYPERKVLVERGFIFVTAHMRGGGELGEAWHHGGRREVRQNTFDDFAAVLSHLHDKGFTRPEMTGIMGASSGGILMGAVLNQNPEKVAAVIATVGVFDMLRFEHHENGPFLTGEYGSVAHEDQFHVLKAYSPYHNVRDGNTYPKVLLTTGAKDTRVDPMHTAKFTACLQAAGVDALMRIIPNQGHLPGSRSAHLDQLTEQLTFFTKALETPESP